MKTLTKTLLSLVALTTASPAMALTYNGTGSADSLDFRQATTRMQVDGRAGNDLIVGGRYSDTLRGGTGRDTIDGWYSNDTLYGGADGDYFRYESTYDGIRGLSGHDTIADFKSGDKIDVYISWLDGDGARERVTGGNFKLFDTNKDGLINKNDAYSTIKQVKLGSSTKPSLVIDLQKAFESSSQFNDDPGTLTIFGVTSLKPTNFVLDYERAMPWYP